MEVIALSKEGREGKRVSFFFEVTLLLRSLSLFSAIIFSLPPHERTNEKLSCMIKGCGKERKKKEGKKSQWGEEEKEAKENGEEEKKIVTLLSSRSGIVFGRDPLPPKISSLLLVSPPQRCCCLSFLRETQKIRKGGESSGDIIGRGSRVEVSSSWSEDVICPYFFASPDLHQGHEKVNSGGKEIQKHHCAREATHAGKRSAAWVVVVS